MVKIGAKLLMLRTSRRMNQEEFAALFDMTRQTYAPYENDKKPVDRELLYQMSKALNISEEDLTRGVSDENGTSERKSTMKALGSDSDTEIPGGYVKKKVPLIPLYDAIAVGGNNILADQSPLSEPIEYIDPGDLLRPATGAMRVYGHSMFPKYPSGCTVTFRAADKEMIFWGEDYVLEMEDRRILKRLEPSEVKGNVKAVSYNKSEQYVYAPVEIPVKKIKRLFMVLGKVELEASI